MKRTIEDVPDSLSTSAPAQPIRNQRHRPAPATGPEVNCATKPNCYCATELRFAEDTLRGWLVRNAHLGTEAELMCKWNAMGPGQRSTGRQPACKWPHCVPGPPGCVTCEVKTKCVTCATLRMCNIASQDLYGFRLLSMLPNAVPPSETKADGTVPTRNESSEGRHKCIPCVITICGLS